MRKVLSLLIAAALSLTLVACQSDGPKTEDPEGEQTPGTTTPEDQRNPDESAPASPFTDIGGVLTLVDIDNSPFADCGLKIEIVHGASGYVKFTKVGLDGTETVDYYNFTPGDMTLVKHNYVSAMGTEYYYTFDLAAGELIKIENKDHEDTTEATKAAGRFDGAEDTIKLEVETLEMYFVEQFGVSIYDAFADPSFGK